MLLFNTELEQKYCFGEVSINLLSNIKYFNNDANNKN